MQACSFLFVERKGSGDASQTTQTSKGNTTELIHERCEDLRYLTADSLAMTFYSPLSRACDLTAFGVLFLDSALATHLCRLLSNWYHHVFL